MNDVLEFLERNRERRLAQLRELLAIPSVSTEPAHRADVRRAAEWLRERLGEAGCDVAEVVETEGCPVVYGERLARPDRPTVLVYGHYDVQPADPVEAWTTPPFDPVVRDGRIWARGAADDKGQLIVHLHAFEAHVATGGECPVNVKFVLEGEEEIGSPSFPRFVEAWRERLACDAIVISDTSLYGPGVPALCHGLRGTVSLEADVRGGARDLHSGDFGGIAVNAAQALAAMLASLKDSGGRIAVQGFYDRVRQPSEREREAMRSLASREAELRAELGGRPFSGEADYGVVERVWCRPTLDVNGMISGFTGEGGKTIIPATAHAKLSMRIVPDQRPEEIAELVAAHLRRVAPPEVDVTVRAVHSTPPWLASTTSAPLQAARRALKAAFGEEPVFIREGGSIGAVTILDEALGVPIVMMGFGLPEDNLHAPDESFDLDNFDRGARAAAWFLHELSLVDR